MSTILITGASSGLGAEMARQFAALGHDLALCARRTDRLEELRSDIARTHPDVRVEAKELDVTDHDAVFRVFEEFRAELGGLDRVVVNAGIGKGQPLGTGRFDRLPGDGRDQRHRRVGADRGRCPDLPRAECRPPGDGFQSVGPPRAAAQHDDVRRHHGSGRPPRRGLPRRRPRHPDQGHRAHPGFIVSEMSGTSARTPLVSSTERGVRAMVEAIEKEKASARVPAWPWAPLGFVIKHVPVGVLRRIS